MNQSKIEKEVRFLKIYAGVTTLLVFVLLLTAFTFSKNASFDEIDVKRINVKDDDGKLRMVISNKDRQLFIRDRLFGIKPICSNSKFFRRMDTRKREKQNG